MIERRERGIRWLVGWKNRQAGIAAAFRRCYCVRISFLAHGLVLIGTFHGKNLYNMHPGAEEWHVAEYGEDNKYA